MNRSASPTPIIPSAAQPPLPATFAARRATFRKLHETGLFVIPNPWDVGTARYLRSLGFKALATTSSGFSFTQGLPDADWAVPRDMALEHIATIAASVDLPVNADFESGYAHEPEALAHNVALCIAESDDLVVPEVFTANFTYYRLRKSDYSDAEIEDVEKRLGAAAQEREVYAFLKHEDTPEGAINARKLLQRLQKD